MELQSIGLAGLEKAQERLAAAAKKLSGAGLQGYAALGVDAPQSEAEDSLNLSDSVNLSEAAVTLLTARQSVEANLKIVETANELASRTIDILG